MCVLYPVHRLAMHYHNQQDGEWVEPPMEGYLMACCDCGLVHKLNFRIVNGRVQLQAFRHNRSTAQKRRHLKTKIVPKDE